MRVLWAFSLLAVVANVSPATSDDDAVLSLVSLTVSGAICNDGSRAGYYFVPASDATGAKHWLIYLEGGGWCYDAPSCMERWTSAKSLMSSQGWESTLRLGGIFSTNWQHSPMYNSNKVFVRYCSSDAHMGDNATSTFGFHFRGRRIVESVVADLVQNKALAQGENHTVVFGGGSAGARGAMVNLDNVQGFIARAGAPYSAQLLGFLDSPLWIDEAPFIKSFPGFSAVTKAVYAFANITPAVDPRCLSLYAGSEWKCIFGQYRVPLLSTPLILVASQYDSFQLGENVGHRPATAAELSYATDFASRTRAVVQELQTHASVFSSACYSHSTSLDAPFYTVIVQGESMSDILWSALTGKTGGRWVDPCQGFACGQKC